MENEKKNGAPPPPLSIIEPSSGKPNGKGEPEKQEHEQEHEVVGIPLLKQNFATLFDNNEDPNVMIFTIPIKALALEQGKEGLAVLLGKIELLKGEAHKLYKGIKFDHASRTALIKPGGGPLPPMGRA